MGTVFSDRTLSDRAARGRPAARSVAIIAATTIAVGGALVGPLVAAAATSGGATSTAPADTMTAAVVRKVDREQGRVTLKHERIANLDMPGMTMVFRVADPKMLESLKTGDQVRIAVENVNGALTVTAIEPAR